MVPRAGLEPAWQGLSGLRLYMLIRAALSPFTFPGRAAVQQHGGGRRGGPTLRR